MNLNPADFNAFLAKVGQAVEWRRSYFCPCRDPDSNAFSSACKVCRNGRIWDPPKCSTVGLSGQKVQRAWAQMGIFEKGDLVVSIPSNVPVYAIGEFDRVLFTDSTQSFSIGFPNTGSTVLNFRATQIDRLFWLNPELTEVIEGSIPSVDRDGRLKFGHKAPPEGTQFTVTGRRNPEYFCFQDLAQDRAHFGGSPLPRQVVLRNYDLFSRGA